MNSSQKVIEKIKELGYEEAEKFFNRTKSSLKTWENNPDKVPAWAADLIQAPTFDPKTMESASATNTYQPVPQTYDLSTRVAQLEARMASVEYRLQPQPGTSVVPPVAQVNKNWTAAHDFSKR